MYTYVRLMSYAYGWIGRHGYSRTCCRCNAEPSQEVIKSTAGGNVTVIRPTGTARSNNAERPPSAEDNANSNYENYILFICI